MHGGRTERSPTAEQEGTVMRLIAAVAVVALLAGCTTLTRLPVQGGYETAGGGRFDVTIGARGEFRASDGALSVTTVILDYEAGGQPVEVCEETDFQSWWIGFTVVGGATGVVTAALLGAAANANDLDGLAFGVMGLGTLIITGVATAGAVGFGIADALDEPECRTELETAPLRPGDRPSLTTPAFLHVTRANGSSVDATGSFGETYVPIDGPLFACPPDCVATTERLAAQPGATVTTEPVQVTVTLDDFSTYGPSPPTTTTTIEVPLIPPAPPAPPVPPPTALDEPTQLAVDVALAEAERAELLTAYGEAHPDVQAVVAKLEALRRRAAELATLGRAVDAAAAARQLEAARTQALGAVAEAEASRGPEHPDVLRLRARCAALDAALVAWGVVSNSSPPTVPPPTEPPAP